MIIKVCGLREPENIRAVEELGVDWIGLIFWPESPRFVSMIRSRAGIIPDYSKERLEENQHLNEKKSRHDNVKRVGVFVDCMPQTIVTCVYNFNLDIIQLHGNETPILCQNLRRTIDPDIHKDIKIMKTISISTPEDVQKYKEYESSVDYFLFDTKCKTVGGSGQQFDWNVLQQYKGDVPFILSGGIGPEDVERIKAFHHPKMIGIDVNSRFESAPGVKDIDKLKAFISQL